MPPATPQGTSQRRIWFWNAAGSLASAFQSFIFLAIVTRLCDTATTDNYSIGHAIAQLMWTVGMFEASTYFVTDAKNRFSAEQYLAFKIISCAAMLAASIPYALSFNLGTSGTILVVGLCLYRLVDAFFAFGFSALQKAGRLDVSGFALFMQYALSIFAFAAVMFFTRDAIAAILVATLAELAWDFPYYSRSIKRISPVKTPDFSPAALGQLFVQLLPLFLATFLANYNSNVPKYAIEAVGQESWQTIFGVLFMPSFVINLFTLFFLRPTLTTLSEQWGDGQLRNFAIASARLLAIAAAITAVILIGTWLVGAPVLSALFSIDLSEHRVALLLTMLGGGLTAMATILYNDVIIIRRQRLVLVACLLALAVGTAVSNPLVASFGISGAAVTYCLINAVLILSYGAILGLELVRRRSS